MTHLTVSEGLLDISGRGPSANFLSLGKPCSALDGVKHQERMQSETSSLPPLGLRNMRAIPEYMKKGHLTNLVGKIAI